MTRWNETLVVASDWRIASPHQISDSACRTEVRASDSPYGPMLKCFNTLIDIRLNRVLPTRIKFLRRTLPLLLAILVLLAQTLALSHRTAHPATGLHVPLAMAAATTDSISSSLFGHTDIIACDDFDAALGLDINPGQFADAAIAQAYADATPATVSQSSLAQHPPGLFLARAPPRA